MKTKDKTQYLLFMMILCCSILIPDAAFSAPSIKIDKLCAYSTEECYVTGQVYDVNLEMGLIDLRLIP